MQVTANSRRYSRFGVETVPARVSLIGDDLELDRCNLLNLSYGGMCFRTAQPLKRDQTYRFVVDLPEPFLELVLVRGRVRWMRRDRSSQLVGIEFIESSSGWFGPDEENRGLQ